MAQFETATSVKSFHQIPGPGGLPYFGSYFYYKTHGYKYYHENLLANYNKYGKIYKETICGRTIVHVLDAEMSQTIYQQEGKWPNIYALHDKKNDYYQKKGITPSVGLLNGEEWARVRSSVQGILMGTRYLPDFLVLLKPTIPLLIKSLENKESDLTGKLNRWNLEASFMRILETSILEGDAKIIDDLIESVNQTFEVSTKLKFTLPLHNYVNTTSWIKLNKAEDRLHHIIEKFFLEAIDRMKKCKEEELEHKFLFLTYFLKKCKHENKDIISTIISLLTDGLSTTVPTLIKQLYFLASNPEKQSELRREVDALLPSLDIPITQQHLQQAQYLKACIREGFRILPIAPEKTRFLNHDIVLGGFNIPAKTRLDIDTNVILQIEGMFQDPDKYKPERWLQRMSKSSSSEESNFSDKRKSNYNENDSSQSNIHPYQMLPFSHGPRTCPGKRIAEQDMQVLLIELVRRFDISLMKPSDLPLRQEYKMLLFPAQQPHFIFSPRSI